MLSSKVTYSTEGFEPATIESNALTTQSYRILILNPSCRIESQIEPKDKNWNDQQN